jgi:hypothetical protein
LIIGFSFSLPTFGSWDLAGNQFTVPQILTLSIIHEKDFVLDAMTRPAQRYRQSRLATAGTLWTGTPFHLDRNL